MTDEQAEAAQELEYAREEVLQAALEAVHQLPEHGMKLVRAAVQEWQAASERFIATIRLGSVEVDEGGAER